MNALKRRKRTKTSGFATGVMEIGFHINFEKVRTHEPERSRLWDFHLYKVNGDRLVKLVYGDSPSSDYWFTSPNRDENRNIFMMIRKRDASNAYNEEQGMNGTYVIWNSKDKKGFILEVLESTTAIPMVDYNQFESMPNEPFMAKVDVRVTGNVSEILTLELLKEDDSLIVEKEGGARIRRTRGEDVLTPVFNPTISASFLSTKSPVRIYAQIKSEDSLLALNNGNLITLEGTSESKKTKSLSTTIQKIKESPQRTAIEERPARTEQPQETETETETETESNKKRKETVTNNPAADQNRLELERIQREDAERRRLQAIADEESEKQDKMMKIAAAGIIVVGIAFFIYKKKAQEKTE